MSKVINIIVRQTGEKTALKGEGNLSISVSAPSVIEIQASPKAATKYIRQGNDLFIYMEDGSVIRCTGYFAEDADSGKHSELLFKDEHGLTHIAFAEAEAVPGMAAAELSAQATPVHSIEPFIEAASDNSLWGWVAGAAVGGGVIGALLGNNGHHTNNKEKVVDNTREAEPARPTFMVADDQGDRQGMLVTKAVTDDNTPVFSGTGHPGATIQIKDSKGNTIASAMVSKEGTWSVKLAAQPDGTHQWSVVQIHGDKTTSAGDIKLTISTQQAELAFETIAEDNQINAAEQSAGFTLSGTSAQLAEGTALSVTLNGKTYSGAVGADGRWQVAVPAEDAQALSDGSWIVSITGQDLTGNVISASQTLSVDTQPPVVSVDTVAQDNLINAVEHNQPLVVSGKTNAAAGQLVSVMVGDKLYTTTVSGDGRWALEIPAADLAALSQGALVVTAAVSDGAGNKGEATRDLLVDTLAPTITINTVANDDMINVAEQQATQTISGTTTAEAGQIITVTFNDQHYTATVDGSGNWSVNVPASTFLGLSDGVHSVNVTVSDRAGNSGSASHNVTLSGEVPTIAIDPFAQDDIINAAEHGTPLVISGTTSAPVGQTVTLTLNGKLYTATVTEGGKWHCTVGSADIAALADGSSYVINAQVNNVIGNSASAEHTVTIDLTAPSTGINIDSLQNDTGLSSSDFITRDGDINVQGSLTAALGNSEKAQISLDGGVSWIDLVVSGKQWTYSDSRTLSDGTYAYQVRVIDSAGNVGATHSQNIVVDLTPPAATAITIDSVSQDHGLSDSDFITSDNQISLHGTLGAALGSGDHLQLSIDGGVSWIDIAASGTRWSWVDERTLADGDYHYMLRVIDDAGNISATASQLVTVDTVEPAIGNLLTIDSISDDTGLSNSDFITKDTSLTLHGSIGAILKGDEFVQISLDGGASWQNVMVIGTSWYYNDGRTLADGNYDYWVRVIDQAGNISGSVHQQVTVDTTAPDAKPAVESISDDSGYNDSDFLTNDTSLILNGSLDAELNAGESLQISRDGGITWVAVEVTGTTWSYTDERELPDGEHLYQLRVVDQAGNAGEIVEKVVSVDLTPPNNVATIDSYSDDTGRDTGEFGSDTTTDDRTPILNGTLAAALAEGERLRIYDGEGNLLGEALVNGTRWEFVLPEPLVDEQQVSYQAVVVDAAGNEGTPSELFTLTVSLHMAVNAQDTLDTTPIVSGIVDYEILDGEYVEVTVNNVVYSSRDGKVVIDPDNNTWYVQIPESDALALGSYEVEAVLYDASGVPITRDKSSGELEVSPSAAIEFTSSAATSLDTGTALTIGEDGTWRILTNSTVFSQSGTSSSTLGTFSGEVIKGTDTQQQSSFIDFDRDGLMDIMGADTAYANGQQSFKYNADGSYTAFQVGSRGVAGQPDDANGNAWVWHAGFMGVDFNGDGYVDVIYGDSAPNDSSAPGGYDTAFVNNTNGTVAGFDKSGTYVDDATTQDGVASINNNNAMPDCELAGVDLNNDGYVDIVYHGTAGTNTTSLGGKSTDNSRLVVVSNGVDANGQTTLTNTQVVTGVFEKDNPDDNKFTTLTWADVNGDGYMDLFVGGQTGQGGATSTIFYNDGAGNLTAAANGVGAGSNVQTLSDSVNSNTSLAVDWNGDGRMDLIEIAGASGATAVGNANNIAMLWLNNGVNASTGQVNWSSRTLFTDANQGAAHFASGALSLDLDYDGDKDLVVFRAAAGATQYVENTSSIQNGTSIILRLSDANGINAFYGNTVLLVDESSGKVVASQMINPQGGVNMNDSSGLVYFYGLDADKTYSAVLLANGNDYGGVASVTFDASGVVNSIENVNASWSGLKAVEKNHAYVLTAEHGEAATDGARAATDGSSLVGIVGTGYNDTLYATAGTHTYNGGGGSKVVSDANEWSSEGGMDFVDYKLAGDTALSIDLSNNSQQATGFGQATFVNIEGIAGGGGNDTFTGSKGDNYFDGRGGNDTFHIGNGGQDTLLYKLLNGNDASGGNGSDQVNGFTVGTWEGTADTDRIDLRELLSGSGYGGSGSATYVNGVATLAGDIGNLSDFIKVVQNGSNTEIQIDRDGAGSQFSTATILTLNGVQTDLATLLANHQLLVV